MKNVPNKDSSTIHLFLWENHFQKDSVDSWHRKLTLKIGFLQFLRTKKELEVIFIKKLYDYKLPMSKDLLTGGKFSERLFFVAHIPIFCQL